MLGLGRTSMSGRTLLQQCNQLVVNAANDKAFHTSLLISK